MTSNDELERQRFERWASDNGKFPRAVERKGYAYLLLSTQSQWETWQAAIASKQEQSDGETNVSHQR
ncbi:hypothetical protein ACP3S8_23075 [Mixta calida]|uniref:hypothetical protein n=1 Tax=Mixta calida TaxID=665913 RepID=UPI003CEC0D8A